MKVRSIIIALLYFVLAEGRAAKYEIDFSRAAAVAAREGDYGLVEHLIESGADPNAAIPDGHTLLMYACRHCYGTPSLSATIRHVRFLIEKGADVNRADSLGLTAMIAAARCGNEELINTLKAFGAKEPNWSDPKIKARVVLVDGEILRELLMRVCTEDFSKCDRSSLPFEALHSYTKDATFKVAEGNGNDIFGKPYLLSTKNDVCVNVDPETMKKLKESAGITANFWDGIDPCSAKTRR